MKRVNAVLRFANHAKSAVGHSMGDNIDGKYLLDVESTYSTRSATNMQNARSNECSELPNDCTYISQAD